MRHEPRLAVRVARSLRDSIAEIQALDALDLDVEGQRGAAHVWRVCAAAVLHAAPGGEAVAAEESSELALANLALVAGVHARV